MARRLVPLLVLNLAVPAAFIPLDFDAEPEVASDSTFVDEGDVDEVRALYTPNDPIYPDQYGPALVRANQAWDINLGSADIKVCVVDTGVWHGHEDLEGARYLGGYNFINDTEYPLDDNSHGTNVTGILAATIDNDLGIAGIAQIGYHAVKVLRHDGGGSFEDVADGIEWCADHGSHVINISLGANADNESVRDAVTYAWNQGSLLVAAAGNDGQQGIDYPARYPEVVAVTCVDSSETLCEFSNWGEEAELAAPGKNIPFTSILCTVFEGEWQCGYDSRYGQGNGTSYSAPHVSGAAALIWSREPGLTNQQVRDRLNLTAKDLGDSLKYGWGLVDAHGKAQLKGYVGDSSTGDPIMGVSVKTQGKATSTNSNGFYMFAELEVGSTTVEFSHPGYNSETRTITLGRKINWLNNSVSPAYPGPKPTASVDSDFDQGSGGLDGARVGGSSVQANDEELGSYCGDCSQPTMQLVAHQAEAKSGTAMELHCGGSVSDLSCTIGNSLMSGLAVRSSPREGHSQDYYGASP